MQAYVYRSQRKADTYLYVAKRDDFSRIPAPVLEPLGELVFVLEFDLQPGRTLARAEAPVVLRNLDHNGYHLQFPPPQSTSLAGDALN